MLFDPRGVIPVGGIAGQVLFFGAGAHEIDGVYQQQQDGRPQPFPKSGVRDEGHRHQPPEDIFGDISRMLGEAIGAPSQNAAVRQVGKAQAKRHGGPSIDEDQDDDDRSPQGVQGGAVRQPSLPVGWIAIGEIVAVEQTPEGRVAHDGDAPAQQQDTSRKNARLIHQ
jgi:hypothetical protein